MVRRSLGPWGFVSRCILGGGERLTSVSEHFESFARKVVVVMKMVAEASEFLGEIDSTGYVSRGSGESDHVDKVIRL